MAETLPIDWAGVQALVCDLDGTLYLGDKALPGALEFVRMAMGHCPVYFLSNNTSKTPERTFGKMRNLGFSIVSDQVLSPLHGLVDAIKAQDLRDLWVMANQDALAWLGRKLPGVNLRAARKATRCVVLAYDDALAYADLCEVNWRLQDGAEYWITHPDFLCPAPEGYLPDVGSFVELFASTTGRRPTRCFGKPSPEVLAPVFGKHSAAGVLFIGDRLYTDWELARRAGCQFRLVLTGETTLAAWNALAGERPALFSL